MSQSFKTTVEIELPAKRYLDFYEAAAKLKGITLGQAIGDAMVQEGDASIEELDEMWKERVEREAKESKAENTDKDEEKTE